MENKDSCQVGVPYDEVKDGTEIDEDMKLKADLKRKYRDD